MTKAEFFQYVKTNKKVRFLSSVAGHGIARVTSAHVQVLNLWSIFALQNAMRRHIFGEPFWANLLREGRRYGRV